MTLRAIPEGSAADTIAAIDALLAAVQRDERVTIPLAIESGSRAWGFPSPTAITIAASSSCAAPTIT